MKAIFLAFLTLSLFADEVSVDCNKVFDERKQEILKEVERLDEARQGLEALKAATNALLDKREAQISQKELDINKTLESIQTAQQKLQEETEANKKILSEIKDAKTTKVTEAYAKMKDNAAAGILSAMSREEAAEVISSLPSKKISGILGKMQPNIASEITLILSKDKNITKK